MKTKTQIKEIMKKQYFEDIFEENCEFVVETIKDEFDIPENEATQIAYEMFRED